MILNEMNAEVTPSVIDAYSLLDLKELNKLHKQSHMSFTQLAEITGLSTSTISRFFNGQSKNPSFANVAAIVKAMGGSLDELIGIEHSTTNVNNESALIPVYQQMITSVKEHHAKDTEEMKAEHAKSIEFIKERYEHILKFKNKLIIALGCSLAVIIIFLLIILTIDALNPSFGYFRTMYQMR